jgi:hypothetical protein
VSTTGRALRWKLAATVGLLAVVAAVVTWGQPPRREGPQGAAATASSAAVHVQGSQGAALAPNAVGDEALGGADPAPPAHSHDRAGAAAAARDYVRALGAMVAMDQRSALAAQRDVASTAAADDLVADLAAKLTGLHRAFPPGSLTYRVAPLAVRLVEESPDAVRADVWYVGVVSGATLAPYEEWVTESYRLVWERHDWRVAAQTSAPGPRPGPGRQTQDRPGELEARLAGFEALP